MNAEVMPITPPTLIFISAVNSARSAAGAERFLWIMMPALFINTSSALAFVPMPSAPIYSASKAAIHSYTQSLRFQLEKTGVEVIELMPPAVKTDLAADIAEGDVFTLMTTDELVKQSFASLKAGALEIRPGQAKLLAFMRRLAPDFINGQLWKASKKLVPVGV